MALALFTVAREWNCFEVLLSIFSPSSSFSSSPPSSFFLILFGFPRRNSWGQFLNAANSLDIPRTGNCFYHRSLHFTDCFGEISSPREKYHFSWLQSDNYSVNDDLWTSRTICQIVHLRRVGHNLEKIRAIACENVAEIFLNQLLDWLTNSFARMRVFLERYKITRSLFNQGIIYLFCFPANQNYHLYFCVLIFYNIRGNRKCQ